MTLIEEQAAEIERLEAERDALREKNARLREAVGLMTTMAPFMELDVNDPVGMAKTVWAEQEKLFQENARLREALLFAELMASETGIDPREKCQRIYDELYKIRAAAAAIREGKHD